MVDRVPNNVRQRILDRFQDRFVEFRVGTFHLDNDFLAATLSQIPDNARKFAPGIPDRLHASLHDPFLQLGRYQVQALRSRNQSRIRCRLAELQDLISCQDEFTYKIHQAVQQSYIQANGCFRYRLVLLS